MERRSVESIRSIALAAGMSFIMYRLQVTSTLFIIPLLFFAPKLESNRLNLVPIGLVALVLIGTQLTGLSKELPASTAVGFLFVNLYLPLTLLIGAAIWIGLAKHSSLRRLLISGAAALVWGLALVLWFSSGSTSVVAVEQIYRAVFDAIAPSLVPNQVVQLQWLFEAVVQTLMLGFLPLFLGQFGLSLLISELLIHRTEHSFQKRLCRWALPEFFVWFFLGSWSVVLATMFLQVTLLQSLAWNIALAITMLYALQGISLVASVMQKRNPQASASRVFVLAILLLLIPGVNLIPLLALPLAGVSETWIKYRK
ncbi:MAG: hypothetical protein ACOXZ4_01330 [Sphaerochaetaceae bacterium]